LAVARYRTGWISTHSISGVCNTVLANHANVVSAQHNSDTSRVAWLLPNGSTICAGWRPASDAAETVPKKHATHAYPRALSASGRPKHHPFERGCFAMPPPRPSSVVEHYRAKLGGLARSGVPLDDPRYDEYRQELRAHVRVERIEKLISEAPPLSAEQRERLAQLLRPVRIAVGEGGDAK
jgi:hypothetical protein